MTMFYKDKQDIINWLDSYQVKGYTLIPDEKYGFVVDIKGDVNLVDKKLHFIPVKFNRIEGKFDCDSNKLNSLEFSPHTVLGSFWCSANELISLEHCPVDVQGDFDCSHNQLQSFEFCPKKVGGDFYSHDNLFLDEAITSKKDFSLAYKTHQKLVKTSFANHLDKDVLPDDLDKSKKSIKVKI